jgi:hypothetical protein
VTSGDGKLLIGNHLIAIEQSEIAPKAIDINAPPSMKLTMKMNFHQPVTVFSLVLGGWFPLALSSARVHVLDRNILIWLRKASKGIAQRKDYEANRWWLEFLNRPSQTINPVFCAMEGAQARVPTLMEFQEEYERACDEVQAYFPDAVVLRHDTASFTALYEIITNVAARHAAEIDFLCAVAPVIREPKTDRALTQARDFVLEQAREFGFKASFTLVAALSCLYEGNSSETWVAAKRVIKPKARYTRQHAHNALSDIRALELLGAGYALGGPTLSLCTRDRALAAFWCHLGIKHSGRAGNAFTVAYDLSPQLFPTLSEKGRVDLAQLLVDCGLVG